MMMLAEQLKRDEGEILHVYKDSLGIRTAGVGHNLEAHGIDLPVGTPITQEQSDEWLSQDIENACQFVSSRLPWTQTIDPVRAAVLQNMAFNIGSKLLMFHNMLTYLQAGKYELAAAEMLHSLWAQQVGARALRLSKQMREGMQLV